MNDTPDDWVGDGRTEDVSTDRSVPADTSWRPVAQRPVDVAAFDGLTMAIVELVAEAEGIDAREVKHPPLYEVADTAALQEAFFDSGGTAGPITTEFLYRGFRVVVRSDGWVSLYEPED